MMATQREFVRCLTSENEDAVVAFCCKARPESVHEAEQRELSQVAVRYLREDLDQNPMPMGASSGKSSWHLDKAIKRVEKRMAEDRREPSCSFGLIAIFSFISALFTIFNAIRAWMRGS